MDRVIDASGEEEADGGVAWHAGADSKCKFISSRRSRAFLWVYQQVVKFVSLVYTHSLSVVVTLAVGFRLGWLDGDVEVEGLSLSLGIDDGLMDRLGGSLLVGTKLGTPLTVGFKLDRVDGAVEIEGPSLGIDDGLVDRLVVDWHFSVGGD